MTPEQEKRLRDLARSSIVGGDIKAEMDEISALKAERDALREATTPLRDALVVARDTLIWAKIFVTSKEHVKKPEGKDLYQEALETVTSALMVSKQERTETAERTLLREFIDNEFISEDLLRRVRAALGREG